jgi:hypothetical protein
MKIAPKRLALLIMMLVFACIIIGVIRSTLGMLEILIILVVTTALLMGIVLRAPR